MPTYVMLSTLTDEGSKTIKHNPERIKEVNAELAALGVKIVAQYATLGQYDFVNIVEAADNLAIARVSAELGSRGTLRLITLPAVDIDTLIAALKK